MKVIVEHDHECTRIATAPAMGPGREIWVGKLIRTVPEWEQETHCLHWTTPAKSIVFLCNVADFRNLEILARCVIGYPTDESWMQTMIKQAKKL